MPFLPLKRQRKRVGFGTNYKQWHPTLVLLPGESHGRRSLVGCSPWGCKESDTTEQLCFHFSLLCTGEGNGNPLQCSCLENPRDGGAWWAAVYGVTQSWTRLKRLSSSSSSNIPTAVGHGCFQEIKELWQGRQAVSLLRVDPNFAGFEAYMYTFHCLYKEKNTHLSIKINLCLQW